ncbi:MAG: acyltransferase [Acidimicrobiales bacterium]|nr:acyltransferase [Acidimicrobiales bacterium]
MLSKNMLLGIALAPLAGAALAGLFGLFPPTREYAPNLYRGTPGTLMLSGFVMCSLLTAVTIAVTVHPAAHLGRLLGNRLFRWIGLRSYGIYLWHWPIFMLTRPGIDVPLNGLPLLVLRFGLTFGIAEFSYRFVEMPIRRGQLGQAFRDLRSSSRSRRKQVALRLGTGGVALLAAVVSLTVGAIASEPVDKSYILNAAPGSAALEKAPDEALDLAEQFAKAESEAATVGESFPQTSLNSGRRGLFGTTVPASATIASTAPPTTVNPLAGKKIVFLGDSVMLGAANAHALRAYFPGAPVDASTSRQVGHGIQVLQFWADAGWLAGVDIVVIHLGTNGTFADYQFDQIMQILQGVPKVAFVNDRVPQRPWQDTNNAVIAAGVARYPGRAVLIDWFAASAGRPELFYDDGTHLRPDGAVLYAEVIKNALS